MGDANTKLFHSIVSAHINFNAIWALKNEEDVWVDKAEQLKELGVKHFSKIFKDDGKTNIGDQLEVIQLFASIVSRDEADVFTSEVTLEEVEGALRTFKRDKIPSPNGWSVEFFLCFFDLVGGDLLNAVEYSRKEGKVISSLNSTFFTLILKNKRPQTFANYRSISL